MTASLLLAAIVAALLLQVTGGIGFAVWRRRGSVELVSNAAGAGVSPDIPDTWRDFRVARREYEDDSTTQCSFHLESVDGLPLPPFKPGQYLTFSLGISASGTEARDIVRCYSLSDRPNPDRYRVTIKRVGAPAGRPDLPPGVASNFLHDRVREGDVLKVKAPSGHFHLDPDATFPVVMVAGGIGITPMMSMLACCLEAQPRRTVHLYYGTRNRGEQAFRQALENLASTHPNFHLNLVCSRPAAGEEAGRDFRHAGHVDIDLLRRTLPAGRHQFYVCGPGPMMAVLVPALADWGVPREDIHFEAFGPASVRFPGDASAVQCEIRATPVDVRFLRSGRTLAWSAQDGSLLEFAEQHGVDVESGCRTGSCGSCETRLVSGTVLYATKPDHDIAPGHCLLCVGTPASALVLEA